MPTLIPTCSDNSLFSHPLFRAQKSRLFEGQGQPVYSLPMPRQPMSQQAMQHRVSYLFPPQPMQHQVLYWLPPQQTQYLQTWMPPIQILQSLNQVPYNNKLMSIQQPQIDYQSIPHQNQQQRFAESQIKLLPIEETRVIQSINQKQDGTHDYISLLKSDYDKILRDKNFNEVPNNCDLKYSLTINNFGNQVYDFHVIQRPEIRIIPFQTLQKTNDATAFLGTPHYFPNNIKLKNSLNTLPGFSPTPSYESSIGAKLAGQTVLFPSSPGSNPHH